MVCLSLFKPRERERYRQTDRQTDRQTEIETETETDRQTGEGDRYIETETSLKTGGKSIRESKEEYIKQWR